MKNKLKKIVLPAFALLLAVSFAFATEAINGNRTGYISTSTGPMEVPGGVNCDTPTNDPCLYLGKQVYADKGFTIPLYEIDE